MSGDGLTDIDLSAFLSAHRASGGVATMAVKEVDDPSLYGVVVHDDDMRVVGFQEKPPREEALSTLCNCGIYAFEPQIFDYIEPGAFVDWAKDVFPALLEDGLPFHCWELETYWNDVGNIEQYRLSNFDALLGRVALDVPGRQIAPRVWVGQGTEIEAGVRLEPPILLGAGCLIESGAELIGPLIIGDGCVVEHGAVLEGVIQWDGAKAGRDSRLAGSILGRNVVVHHEAVVHEDAVIGDRSEVAPHTLIEAGARLEPRTSAGPRLGTTPAAARSDDAAGSARRGRTRRLARPRLPAALRRLPCSRVLALRRLRRRTAARCPTTVAGAAARRSGAPAGRRAPAPARGACRPAASAPAATSQFSAATAAFCYEGPARALVTACKFRALRSLTDELAERAATGVRGRRRPRRRGGRRHLRSGAPRSPARPRVRPRGVVRPAACTGRRAHLCSAAPPRAPRRPSERARPSLARGQRPSSFRVARRRFTGRY